jgi:hypothetical protein
VTLDNLSSHKSAKAAARTYEDLWRAVGDVCGLFTEQECLNFFNADGYETNQTRHALGGFFRNARVGETRHATMGGQGRPQQGNGRRRTGPFAQAHAKIQQG